MKVYKVEYYDNSNGYVWDEDRVTLGYFSSEERAYAAGEHLCKTNNEKYKYPKRPDDPDFYEPDYQFRVYTYDLDHYYIENLTPLAVSMGEINDD